MFGRARLKLTAWYLLIIMLISISFSLVIYRVLLNEVDRFSHVQKLRIERRFRDLRDTMPGMPVMDNELVEEIKRRLTLILIAVNGGILFISGGLGYFLAGRTLRPIKEMLDEQNRFISDASHELRTPLTSLKSAMEVNLRDKNLNLKDSKKLIAESIDEINKLQVLSDELLQLAQYQTVNGFTKSENVTLFELIDKAVNKIRPLAKQKNITIYNRTHKIEIKGNRYGLFDLFTILLDNAIKYSKESKSITINSKETDGYIAISFKDEGIGIEKKDISHIFDRFYRTDTARTKTEAGGYGLGLSIAKKIVDIHHGSISVESKINKGSIFTVRLPIFS